MTKTNLKVAAGCVVVLGGIWVSALLIRSVRVKLEVQRAQWAAREALLTALRRERDQLKAQAQAVDGERQKREADRLELARLRAEVTSLRQQIANATQPPTPAQPSSVPVSTPARWEDTQDGGPVRSFTSTLTVDVAPGETLFAGGWEMAPGQRGLVLLNPSTVQDAKSGEQVYIQSRFVKVPEGLLNEIGWGGIRTDQADSDQGWLASTADGPFIDELLLKSEGVEILSGPRVITLNGIQAEITVRETVQIDGRPYGIGPSLQVTPQVLPDGAGVRLSMNAAVILPAGASAPSPGSASPSP